MPIHFYLSQDRLRAISQGSELPTRVTGSALFADISGFTVLTEALSKSLGTRRGPEELTKLLDQVYTTLLSDVERYGGSVLNFSGDSILCWFDNLHGPAAERAVRCGLDMQTAMLAFSRLALPNGRSTTLALKVAIASGPARRFMVGNPDVHYVDVLTGLTISRTATGEHLAQKGEILLDEATFNQLSDALTIQEWRGEPGSERFAVISGITNAVDQAIFPDSLPDLPQVNLRSWVHPLLYEREMSGYASFLTEFRPCLALFLRFSGIDYDSDEAEQQLDLFVREIQAITARHDGYLMQLTFGDKGSYVYINFGALNTHEDDALRAVMTALELRNAVAELDFSLLIQIGITQGVMRVGAYGGKNRRAYGALGDDVNLAARLMQVAAPGEILVSNRIQKEIASLFNFEPRAALTLKGKSVPLTAFSVSEDRHPRSIRLQEPLYALPIIGRKNELNIIQQALGEAATGKAQMFAFIGESGLGKSRLIAETIRIAKSDGFATYGGACQAIGISTPYQAWRSTWSAFFAIDPDLTLIEKISLLGDNIKKRVPQRLPALPLLAQVLDIPIPENEFTTGLTPKNRKEALHALLADCLRSDIHAEPFLIVIEDLHWIDSLSLELLSDLAYDLAETPICFALAYRPSLPNQIDLNLLESYPAFIKIKLSELTPHESKKLIEAKLNQLYLDSPEVAPTQLVDTLTARAQGNPFYIEELINLLRDRGINPYQPSDWDTPDLPDSLHTLILSRIDQLSEQEKTTLRLASIIGRLFSAKWLAGYSPMIGDDETVKESLEELHRLDVTILDTPEPELIYLFKHIVTHEAAYENLPFATRAQLHEQLAQYLEQTYPDALPLNELAFHYGRSENKNKQREYLYKAGEAAQAAFANDAALRYYQQLLLLLTDGKEKADIHLKRGDVLKVMGEYAEAETEYQSAFHLAQESKAEWTLARSEMSLGGLCAHRGEYERALDWYHRTLQRAESSADMSRTSESLHSIGSALMQKGEYSESEQYLQQALEIARSLKDNTQSADILNTLGMSAVEQGRFKEAYTRLGESQDLYRQIGSKEGLGMTTNNLGLIELQQEDFESAWEHFQETLTLARVMGNKRGIAIALSNLGYTAANQGNFSAARTPYEESLALYRKIGSRPGIATSLENLGFVEIEQGDFIAAQAHYTESLHIAHETGNKFHTVYSLLGLASAGIKIWTSHPDEERVKASALLLSAANALMQSMNLGLERLENEQFERMRQVAHTFLGKSAFENAWQKGQATPAEEAINLALSLAT